MIFEDLWILVVKCWHKEFLWQIRNIKKKCNKDKIVQKIHVQKLKESQNVKNQILPTSIPVYLMTNSYL